MATASKCIFQNIDLSFHRLGVCSLPRSNMNEPLFLMGDFLLLLLGILEYAIVSWDVGKYMCFSPRRPDGDWDVLFPVKRWFVFLLLLLLIHHHLLSQFDFLAYLISVLF